MSDLYSASGASAGIWRANVIQDCGDGTARVYIPMLHRKLMPFLDPQNLSAGIVEGCEANYPLANRCCFGVRTPLNVGDAVWVTFENGDMQYPIIMGNFGTCVQEYVPGSSGGGGGDYGGGYGGGGIIAELIVPDEYGTVCTYEKEIISNEKYHGWAKSSKQGQLRRDSIDNNRMRQGDIFGLKNCAIVDDRLMIATKPNIGGNFPVEVGDYLDVYFTDGTVWNCILGDTKGAGAEDSAWGHNQGASVVEIIYWDYSTNSGNISKKISKITKVGNFWTGMASAGGGGGLANLPIADTSNLTTRQRKVLEFGSTYRGSGNSAKTGYCQAWVADVYSKALGMTRYSKGSGGECARSSWALYRIEGMPDHGGTNKKPTCSQSQIPLGACVWMSWSAYSGNLGHVGLWIGDGKILGNHGWGGPTVPQILTLDQYKNKGYKGFVWGWNGNVNLLEG